MKTARDRSKPDESKLLIEPQRIPVCRDHCIELKDLKSKLLSLFKAVPYKAFSDALPSKICPYRITGIADMSAAPHIVRV